MIDCEEAYIGSLLVLKKVYKAPMKAKLKYLGLKPSDLNVIFSPILEAILTLHTTLLSEFRSQGARRCGRVLEAKAPYFKLYTQYLNGYDAAIDKISALRERYGKFRKFLAKQRKGDAKSGQGWKYMNISSYLIMPVQRIPRYELLLKEIIKYTPPGDIELESLRGALATVRSSAQHNNKSMRSYENMQKLLAVQSKLHGDLKENLIKPSRNLLLSVNAHVTLLTKTDAEALAPERATSPTRRRSPVRNLKRRGSALDLFEKLKHLRSSASVDDHVSAFESQVFLLSDMLVWVASDTAEATTPSGSGRSARGPCDAKHNFQGFLGLDWGITTRILNKSVGKTHAILVRCSQISVKITISDPKKAAIFHSAVETAAKELEEKRALMRIDSLDSEEVAGTPRADTPIDI